MSGIGDELGALLDDDPNLVRALALAADADAAPLRARSFADTASPTTRPRPVRGGVAAPDVAVRDPDHVGPSCRLRFPGRPRRVGFAATPPPRRGDGMATEGGQITGTKDKDYNVIWFTEACLSNVLRLETYIQDAEREGDSELADFFRRAQGESRKGAEQGKDLLKKRLGSA
jgi:hypothetical protein